MVDWLQNLSHDSILKGHRKVMTLDLEKGQIYRQASIELKFTSNNSYDMLSTMLVQLTPFVT